MSSVSIPAIEQSAGLCDAAPVVKWSFTDRGLTARVRPTWVGTRKYMTDSGEVTVLRRPSQVLSQGHLDTLGRLTGTRRHPSREGKRVFLSAQAKPGSIAPWDPSVELQPHRDYFVGSVGDKIDIVHVPGMGKIPEVTATVCDATTLGDIRNGLHEVSYGYVGWFLKAAEVPLDEEVPSVGQWMNPETGKLESFDLECLCDPTDPRIPDNMRPFLGGNHLAFAVPSGRGGPDVRLLLDEQIEALKSQTAKPIEAYALLRKVDESGNSGTGMVALVLTFEGGPAVCLWLTKTASGEVTADLDTWKAIHLGNHAEGANELVPLALGLPIAETPDEEGEEPEETEDQPAELALGGIDGAPPTGDQTMLIDPNKNGGAPNNAPLPPIADADLRAALESKTKEYDELLEKYNKLVQENAELKQQLTATSDAKGTAEAKADELTEELIPYRERYLKDLRARSVAAVHATGAVADALNAATLDTLPGLVVEAYYSAHPQAKSVVDDYDGKLKQGGWLKHRFETILEQASLAAPKGGGVSDSFREALKVPAPKHTPAGKSPQQELDELG